MSTQREESNGYRIIDRRTDKDAKHLEKHEWETLRRLFKQAGRPAEFIDPDKNSEMVH